MFAEFVKVGRDIRDDGFSGQLVPNNAAMFMALRW
jgi:hypothetical protein